MTHLYSFVDPIFPEHKVDDQDSKSGTLQKTFRSVLSDLWLGFSVFLRNTSYLFPAAVCEERNWNWINILGISSGFFVGSLVKLRFQNLWFVGTVAIFTGRLLLDFGVISINWERVSEIRRKFNFDRIFKKTPDMVTRITSVPFCAFFATGLLVGIKFG